MYHNPVLLHAAVDGLKIREDGVYVDVTFGGGGHSAEILKRLGENGKLIAFDQDEAAHQNKLNDPRLILVRQNFRDLKKVLRFQGFKKVDGILADLGVSSRQFDDPSRGFSIRFDDARLDMRMNTGSELSASEILQTWPKERLTMMLREFGELPQSGRMADRIIKKREDGGVETVGELKSLLSPFAPRFKEHNFYARVFQALRIAVNEEIQTLEKFLIQTTEVLDAGGRLVVISYHSLEDRLVKNFMRSGKLSGEIEKDFYGNVLSPFEVITRKAIVPDEEEIAINNRARSAKLRIAEKKDE